MAGTEVPANLYLVGVSTSHCRLVGGRQQLAAFTGSRPTRYNTENRSWVR